MGAPKYKQSKVQKAPKAIKDGPNASKDRLLIEQYKKKIDQMVQSPEGAKKAALIIEQLINKSLK